LGAFHIDPLQSGRESSGQVRIANMLVNRPERVDPPDDAIVQKVLQKAAAGVFTIVRIETGCGPESFRQRQALPFIEQGFCKIKNAAQPQQGR
jgi:hypothetical protein